jgi:uncharacterized protein involved in exopolysaccharide biosynthesis
MSMLKFDHDMRPDFEPERSDLRAHYENLAARKLQSILLSTRRHWRLIASAVTLALTLALILLPLLPRKYVATALIYPKLFSSAPEKSAPRAIIEAGTVVASETRLIHSDAILRAVAKRLAPDTVIAEPPSWTARGLEWLKGLFLPESQSYSPFDRTVAMLRNTVVVTNESRSYLISISATAPSADEAARVVNAFAIEYFREKSKQSRQDELATAEAELVRQRAINGERHPKVLQAADELSAARAALTAAGNAGGDAQDTIVTDEDVAFAIPNRTPTSPKGSVILALALGLGLLSGVALATWRDRRGLEPHRRLRDVLPVDLVFSQNFPGRLLASLAPLYRHARKTIQTRMPQLSDKGRRRGDQGQLTSLVASDEASRGDNISNDAAPKQPAV